MAALCLEYSRNPGTLIIKNEFKYLYGIVLFRYTVVQPSFYTPFSEVAENEFRFP